MFVTGNMYNSLFLQKKKRKAKQRSAVCLVISTNLYWRDEDSQSNWNSTAIQSLTVVLFKSIQFWAFRNILTRLISEWEHLSHWKFPNSNWSAIWFKIWLYEKKRFYSTKDRLLQSDGKNFEIQNGIIFQLDWTVSGGNSEFKQTAYILKFNIEINYLSFALFFKWLLFDSRVHIALQSILSSNVYHVNIVNETDVAATLLVVKGSLFHSFFSLCSWSHTICEPTKTYFTHCQTYTDCDRFCGTHIGSKTYNFSFLCAHTSYNMVGRSRGRVSDYFDIPLVKPALILTNWRRFDIGVNSLKWSVYDNAVLVDNLFIQNVIMNLINYKAKWAPKFQGSQKLCAEGIKGKCNVYYNSNNDGDF